MRDVSRELESERESDRAWKKDVKENRSYGAFYQNETKVNGGLTALDL